MFTLETAKMILKTISSYLLLVYILTNLSAAKAANTNRMLEGTFQESNNKFQAALLINKRDGFFDDISFWYFQRMPFEKIASGAILNKRWVLTASALKWTSVKDITVVVNDQGKTHNPSFDDPPIAKAGFDRRNEAQHVMVDFWKEVGDLLLLHLAADLVFAGNNEIQKSQLPRSWLRKLNVNNRIDRRTFEYGFPPIPIEEENANCWVSGWSGQNQVQREVEVDIVECPGDETPGNSEVPENTICVRRRENSVLPVGLLSMAKNLLAEKVYQHLPLHWFFNRNNMNAGSLLSCRYSHQDERRLLMGVGVGDDDIDGIFSLERVSPQIEELNKVMIKEGDHHAEQDGVGQWRHHSWLAHVYADYAEGESTHVCEGTFATVNAVITAASCLGKFRKLRNHAGNPANSVSVRYAVDDMDDGLKTRKVLSYKYPKNAEGESYDANEVYDFHNIAVLLLEAADRNAVNWFKLNIVIPKIVGVDARTVKGCQVTGWENSRRRVIKFHRLKVHDTERCISPILRPAAIEKFYSHHLCAHESTSNGIIPGSPLTCVGDNGDLVLYGIASYDRYMPINRHKTYTNVGVYKVSIDRYTNAWDNQNRGDSQNEGSQPAASGNPGSRYSGSGPDAVHGSHCSNRNDDCQIL